MRYLFFILSLLIAHTSLGQQFPDTCLSRLQLHELRYRLYHLRDQNETQQLQIRILEQLDKTDTVHLSKDSIVINYLGKEGKLLRTQKKYLKNGCTRDSVVMHYNNKGLLEYSENWSSSLCDADTTDEDELLFIYKNAYSRYEYDSLNRITKNVFHLSTPMTRRILYHYDKVGKRTTVVEKINDYEFWD